MSNRVNQYTRGDQVFNVSVDNAPVGIIETDMMGNCLYVNKMWCEMTGISEEKAIVNGWVKGIHPEDRKLVTRVWSDEIEMQQNFEIEFRFLSPKKKLTYVQCHGSSLVNDDGETIGLIATMTDISERIQLEKELLSKNHFLQQFRYIISHDLRSPIRNMIALTSFYNKDDVHDKNNLDIIDKVEQCGRKLEQLLKDLINVTEETQPIREVMKEIKFNHVLNSIKESLESIIITEHVKIFSDFSEATHVKFTNIHLHSIMLNLITNAIKYRSPEREPEIHLRSYIKGKFTYLEVADNGSGIDLRRHRDKMFGLFQRFHENADSKGLGLFIINSIAIENGGKITVESELGKGTTFTVSFKTK